MDGTLDKIRHLCETGAYLKAFELSKEIGPLDQWEGADELVLAGRLAFRLGAARLGFALHRRSVRQFPDHVDSRYYFCFARLLQFGPLSAWKWMRRFGDPVDITHKQRADWLGLKADVMAAFRDFDRAEEYIAQAIEADPDDPFVHIQKASVFITQDKLDEALASARHSLSLQAWYRPAVECIGHLLVQLNRDEEAIEFLTEGSKRLESGSVIWQLALLHRELDRDKEFRRLAESVERYYPLMDKSLRRSAAALIASSVYRCGDFKAALRWAEQVDDKKNKFFQNMRERLADPDHAGERVQLPVPFVRQHHDTCAPATLSSLSRFWGKPVDQAELAEEICYGGTPSWRSRQWAENNGFLVHEFRVDWDTAVALLDRGVPFACEVGAADWSHIQSLVGYDSRLRTFLIRDSNHRVVGEALADEMLKEQAAYGPRGMVLVPKERAELLDGIELPEVDYHDDQYEMQLALERHDRDAAAEAIERVTARNGDHRMSLLMRWALASYDQDLNGRLRCVDSLLEQYPDNARLTMAKLNLLIDTARREERLDLLRAKCREEEPEYVIWQQYAAELLGDAREHPTAEVWLRRAIRANPGSGAGYAMLATILWDRMEREESLELKRFAACLELTREQYVKDYFIGAAHMRREPEALELLRGRVERFSQRSGAPALSLCWAYSNLARIEDLTATLEAAIKDRPEDGDLLLAAARHHTTIGELEAGDRRLEEAKPFCRRVDWLRAAGRLAEIRGEPERALELCRQAAEIEPIAYDLHETVARLTSDMHGSDETIRYLEEVVSRFPFNCELRALYIQWLGDEGPEQREQALRDLLALNPADPEARERLSFTLRAQGRLDEAMVEAERALELDPTRPSGRITKAMVHEYRGEIDQAAELCREAIHLSIDSEWALEFLLHLSDTLEKRRAALAFIHDELTRQVTFGDGLITFRMLAADTFEPEELLRVLQEAHASRPDLWHAWSALARQLADMDRLDEAVDIAGQAVERFPLMPGLWLDMALIHRAAGKENEELAALERALRIAPNWPEATRELADAHQRRGDSDQAKAVLERAIVTQPGVAVNHGYLADVLWEMDEREAALEQIKIALRLEPGYRWAWDTLRTWSREVERPEMVIDAARDLTEKRPHQARSWFILADLLDGPDQRDDAIEALDRAIAVNPVYVDAHQLKAYYLSEQGRYDEALAACQPEIFGDHPPWDLRMRAAQIEGQRGNLEQAAEQMKAGVDENPDYFVAWQRLADLYCEMRDAEGYLDAARNMVRLEPEAAIAHGYLGEALQVNEQLDEAKKAFQKAIEFDPNYEFAAFSLYDLAYDQGDCAVIGDLITRLKDVMSAEMILSWRVGLAVLRTDREAAMNHLRELASIDADETRPLHVACIKMVQAGWGDVVSRMLRELSETRDGQPVFATSIVAGSHFANMEELSSAVRFVRSALEVRPDYHQGWRWLCNWTDHTHQLDDYLEATRRSAELDPTEGVAIACIGDAHLQRGEVDDALAAFRQAVEVSPDNEYSVTQLFDLQLQLGDLHAAEQTLEAVGPHMPASYQGRQRVRLAVARGGIAAAREPLESLCRLDEEIEYDLMHALDGVLMLTDPKRVGPLLRMLKPFDSHHPAVGAAYVTLACRRSLREARKYVDAHDGWGEFWHRAAGEYLLLASRQTGQGYSLAPRKWLDRLFDHPRTWGAFLAAGVENGDYQVLDICPTETSGGEQDPVGLMYAEVALSERGQAADAASVGESWREGGGDYRVPNAALWMACSRVLQGRWIEAADYVHQGQPEHMSHYNKALYRIAHTLVQMFQWMPEGDRPRDYESAVAFYEREIGYIRTMIDSDLLLRRVDHGAMRRIALQYGRPLKALWRRALYAWNYRGA